jgi:hypothetical protein
MNASAGRFIVLANIAVLFGFLAAAAPAETAPSLAGRTFRVIIGNAVSGT